MKAISVEQDYHLIEIGINGVIDKSKSLPEKIFHEALKYFLFITFDELFMTLFFNNLKHYLIDAGEKGFWLAVVDPDPRLYFATHFAFFGAFEFSSSDEEGDYLSALNDYPKDSPADALAHNSNSLIVSPFTNEWAILGNRNADIAICAFSDRTKMELFRFIYGSDLLGGVKEAAEYAYGASGEKSQREKFCKSYSPD